MAEVRGARPCGGCHRSGAEKEEETVREIGGDQEEGNHDQGMRGIQTEVSPTPVNKGQEGEKEGSAEKGQFFWNDGDGNQFTLLRLLSESLG